MRLQPRTVEFVFDPDGGRQCHAASLAVLPDGDLLCAWFAGTHEGHRDTAIWLAHRRDGEWLPPACVAKVNREPHWNPVLFADPGSAEAGGGRIHLFFKAGPSPRAWRTWWTTRREEEGTWSEPRELVPGDVGGRGPVRSKPVTLADGDWLAPASIETVTGWDCFTDCSPDHGRTWQRSDFVPRDPRGFAGPGIIQPTLWESAPGRVHMLTRSSEERVFRADSADGGRSWSPVRPTDLPNNNSALDLERVGDGALVLALNPVAGNWGVRTPLTLLGSLDDGDTWHELFMLEDGPGEYSYPSVIATGPGLAVAYTWRRRSIRVWEFDLETAARRVTGPGVPGYAGNTATTEGGGSR